jgi:hypothetical protein
MILLTASALTAQLSVDPTTPWQYSVGYEKASGNGNGGDVNADDTIADNALKTLVATPDGYVVRSAKIVSISIFNADTVAATLTLKKGAVTLWKGTVSAGYSLKYVNGEFKVLNENSLAIDAIGGSEGVMGEVRKTITAAEIVALGAVLTGLIDLGGSLPAGARIINAYLKNGGDAATGVTTLTCGIGHTTGEELVASATVKAANVGSSTILAAGPVSLTAATTLKAKITTTVDNCDQLTALANGVVLVVQYAKG